MLYSDHKEDQQKNTRTVMQVNDLFGLWLGNDTEPSK